MLKILLLEDNQDDVELISLELNKLRDEYEFKVALNKDAFLQELHESEQHIILCDVNVPGYSGEEALKSSQKICPNTSVIMVTGTISGEDALKYVVDLGAKDYVLKNDMKRLVPAIVREYEHYKLKEIREKQDEWLEIFSQVAHQTDHGIIITDNEGKIKWVNEAYESITGYLLKDCYGQKPGRVLRGADTDRSVADHVTSEIKEGHSVTAELLNYTKNGDKFWSRLNISPLKNSEGDIHHFLALQEDITNKKRTLDSLEQTLKSLESAQELGKMGDWHYNVETKETFWSKQLFSIYGRDIKKGPPPVEDILKIYYGKDQELHNKVVNEALKQAKDFDITVSLINEKDPQRDQYVRIIGKPRVDDLGKVQSLHGIVQDVTESVLTNQELETTKKFHQLAIEGTEVGLWELDLNTFGVVFNDIYFSMLGYEREEVASNKDFHDSVIHPEDHVLIESFLKEILEGTRTAFEATIRLKNKGGEYVHVLDRARVVEFTPEGIPTKLAGSHIDISERVIANKNLARSYKEKEILLQEIHHRVKNNLAIVSGLLWLEMDSAGEEFDTLPLSRSVNRIQSMGKVHELLYNSESLSQINIKEYVTDMAQLVIGNANLPYEIHTELDIEDTEININEMMPLALLLNELMTNSLKYAFNEKKGGTISVLFWQEGEVHHMSYRDTGPGIEGILDIRETNTLGLEIISVLLDQLGAKYTLDTDQQFRLDFSFYSKEKGAHSHLVA